MKIYIETLGCSKNTIDSENMAALLEKDGHEMAESAEDAEVIIVNTCAFIKDAKTQSIDTIFEMSDLKEDSDKILIVAGCLSQRYADELYEEIPEADILIGVNNYDQICSIIDEFEAGKRVKINDTAPSKFCEIPERKTEDGAFSAYIRISEGCDNVCSYCVIPSIRGAFRSRSMESIIGEANMLADRGVKELVLIAQDVTAYGKDLYGEYALYKLLRELCKIEKLHWIRLLYCYEESITDELIETMKTEDKICKYIDIPLQHINDGILDAMNRHSTTQSIKDKIAKLREEIPEIHIRTTFIVGFPGEHQDEFAELEEFVEETKFDRMGAFSYSQEENTLAAEMPDQIDDDVKEERRDIIMELQRSISLENNQKKVGKVMEVLVEEKNDDGTWFGRTQFDAPEIDDSVILTSDRELVLGEFVEAEITDAFDYDLTAKVKA